MRAISKKNRERIAVDPFYRRCVRENEATCAGRITIEHALIHAGRQIDALWALLPVCAFHHAVCEHQDSGDLRKEVHLWYALNRASDEELRAISKAVNYLARRDYLNKKYGVPVFPEYPLQEIAY